MPHFDIAPLGSSAVEEETVSGLITITYVLPRSAVQDERHNTGRKKIQF